MPDYNIHKVCGQGMSAYQNNILQERMVTGAEVVALDPKGEVHALLGRCGGGMSFHQKKRKDKSTASRQRKGEHMRIITGIISAGILLAGAAAVTAFLRKEPEQPKGHQPENEDEYPTQYQMEIIKECAKQREFEEKMESHLESDLLNGRIRLSDIPFEERILSDWPYITAMRYDRNVSKEHCIEDMNILKDDLMRIGKNPCGIDDRIVRYLQDQLDDFD